MERAEIQQAAQVVAKQLNETNKGAIRKIEMIIEHLGIEPRN